MGSCGARGDSGAARGGYGIESDLDIEGLVPEGVEGTVPYKGPLRTELIQLTGGVRKCMGYLGVRTIAELHQHSQFWEQSQAGMGEAHPSVKIIKKSPNYSGR